MFCLQKTGYSCCIGGEKLLTLFAPGISMNYKTNAEYQALFQSYLLTEKRLSRNSVSAYMADIAKIAAYLEQQGVLTIANATEKALKAYVRQLHVEKMQPRTIARKISAYKVLYSFLAERYGIENVAQGLVIPKIEKTLPIYLTHEEIVTLLTIAQADHSAKGKRNCMMLQLLYATGLRITELVTLRLEMIHFDTGFLSVMGKGERQRDIPLPLPVIEKLRQYVSGMLTEQVEEAGLQMQPKTLVFPTIRSGKMRPITRQSFWGILKKMLELSGITKNVSPHTLRHSLATHLLQAGADIRSLQLWLGHEQISTVEIYTHLDKSLVRRTYDHKHPRA